MFDSFYRKRLRQDLETWQSKGWVSPDSAASILADQDGDDTASRLPLILGGIGAVCVALAVAAFVAANWEAIGKAPKLLGIAVLITTGHGLAARWATRGRTGLADLATGFATLVFIAGIALVGQMFHLPANWAAGSLIVCLGALAASWLGASRTALLVAAIAAVSWQIGRGEPGETQVWADLFGIGLMAVIAAHTAVFPLRVSRWAVSILVLVTYSRWLIDAGTVMDVSDETAIAMVLAGFAALGVVLVQLGALADLYVKWCSDYPDKRLGRWLLSACFQDFGIMILATSVVVSLFAVAESSGSAVVTALLAVPVLVPVLAIVLMSAAGLLLSFKTAKARTLFVATGFAFAAVLGALLGQSMVLGAALSLAALVGITLLGNQYKATLWMVFGYGGLAIALLWLLYETVGSLLGQAVFFLLAGVVLLGVAFMAAKLFRRNNAASAPPTPGAAS